MRFYRHCDGVPPAADRVVACGTFDGLHLGNRRLLAALTAQRADQRLVVLIRPRAGQPRLASLHRLCAAFAAAGADALVVARPQGVGIAEMQSVLTARRILIGGGDAEALQTPHAGAAVTVVDAVAHAGAVITSARLRTAVAAGDLALTAALLGEPYTVDGRVVHGFHRGAAIGVPTANLRVHGLALPPDGVYAVTVRLPAAGSAAPVDAVGVANLGRKPTFGDRDRALETHVFDFAGDLYGQRIEVGFVERLRDERRFADVDELVAQIGRDIAAARRIHGRDD